MAPVGQCPGEGEGFAFARGADREIDIGAMGGVEQAHQMVGPDVEPETCVWHGGAESGAKLRERCHGAVRG